MRKTSKAHPCYEQLFKATQKIKDMTDYFNEQKKDSENADYVQKVRPPPPYIYIYLYVATSQTYQVM